MDYTVYQDEASVLLDEFGDTVTITLASGSRVRTKGIFVQKNKRTEDVLDVSPLTTTERICIVKGNLAKRPAVGDTLTYGKIIYTISEVDDIQPTSTTIIYKLTVDV